MFKNLLNAKLYFVITMLVKKIYICMPFSLRFTDKKLWILLYFVLLVKENETINYVYIM